MIAEASAAERLLHELGITDAREINVEVIARAVGVSVRYLRLARCDARIVGLGDRAIITVDQRASRVRRRFSIAHELGHWHHHRGRQLVCRLGAPDAGASTTPAVGTAVDPERQADLYAADLLMPTFLVDHVLGEYEGQPSLRLVERLAQSFGVSITAAAMRVIERYREPAVLIVRPANGRAWFRRSPGTPDAWFIRPERLAQAAPASPAGSKGFLRLPVVGTGHWFAGTPLHRRVTEEALTLPSGTSISLLGLI